MTLLELFRNIRPYARPYRGLIALTLGMTCVASFTAQVNAWVLRHTVDELYQENRLDRRRRGP